MNKYVKWGIVGVIVLGFAGWGVYNLTPKENKDLKEAPVKEAKGRKGKVLNVRAVRMQQQDLSDALYVSGSLLPDEEVNLTFETSGKITEIYFKQGAFVRKGQLLAKINDASLQAQLKKLEVQLKLYQDRLYRQNALLEKEAVSKEAYQEAETSLATLEAEIELVKANIAHTELRAPFDGVIGLRSVSQGAYASQSTPVACITKINPLKVEFSVPERYATQIQAGSPLTFTMEGDLRERNAKVYALDSRVDDATRTIKVRAHYDNSNGALVPGRYVNVTLTTSQYANTLAVPSEAVVSEMGIDKVFLYKEGKAQPVEIQKGVRTADKVQVLDGLSVGDTVIVSGTMQIRTGQKVTLDEVK